MRRFLGLLNCMCMCMTDGRTDWEVGERMVEERMVKREEKRREEKRRGREQSKAKRMRIIARAHPSTHPPNKTVHSLHLNRIGAFVLWFSCALGSSLF